MAPQTLVSRVDKLEERVTILEQLPARVDALALQISQLRNEIRAEFSATRQEALERDEETRRLFREQFDETRAEMRMLHEDALSPIAMTQEGKARRQKRR